MQPTPDLDNEYYPESLLKDYGLLLQHFPSHVICRPYVVEEIEKWRLSNLPNGEAVNILEVGAGYGETTSLILGSLPCVITVVEVDTKALNVFLTGAKEHLPQLNIVTEDALTWIKNVSDDSYNVFTASWTIHNFPEDQRDSFLKDVYRVLKPGGLFIIFDKVHLDDREIIDAMWKMHIERLSALDSVGKSDLKNEMITHETRDMEKPYVWYESEIFDQFEQLGFKNTKVVMRNERDVVFSATK